MVSPNDMYLLGVPVAIEVTTHNNHQFFDSFARSDARMLESSHIRPGALEYSYA